MRRKKMKINGLFIFSLIIGTFSLSLNRSTIQADLTQDATTLPSVDIVQRNTGVYTDSDFTVYSIETAIPTPDVSADQKEKNLSHCEEKIVDSHVYKVNLQLNFNSKDDPTDFSESTTIRPQNHPSYFAQFRARRNAACNSEVDKTNSEPKDQDLSKAYCIENIEEEINDNEKTKEVNSESESFTEKSLGDITVHEETTDIPQVKNIQEKLVDDTQIESSGQDTDSPVRFQLDLESILTKKIAKRESSLYENTSKEIELSTFLEEIQTTASPINIDDTNEQLLEYDYDQFPIDVEKPHLAVRLLYKLGYLYSLIDEGTLNVNKLANDISNKITNRLKM